MGVVPGKGGFGSMGRLTSMAEPWMDAAVAAQRAWVATPFEERRGIVGAFLDAVHGGESERFAVLLAEEARLPVREARYQIRTRLSAVVALYACPRPRDGTSGDGVAVVERARGVVLLEVGPDEALLTFARATCMLVESYSAVFSERHADVELIKLCDEALGIKP